MEIITPVHFQDYYNASFYTKGTKKPSNTSAGTEPKRVGRGGSWNYHSAKLFTYARAADFENRGDNHFGFRIVKNSNKSNYKQKTTIRVNLEKL